MDIVTYRKKAGLTQSDFAALLAAIGSSATQGLVSHWENGTVKVPPERWRPIEKVTGGAVTRHDLRPDLFQAERAA